MSSSEHSANRVITLTTDFGYHDPFVGQMKGVILSINPQAKIIDITHDIVSHDIEEAALVIWESFKYFPEGSIHVVVVDPGVGSGRKALAVFAYGHYFLAPDNGVLSYILRDFKFQAFSIENERYMLKKSSSTFQGRDLFAPASAWISKGINIKEFGPACQNPIRFEIKEPKKFKEKIIGEIIRIDKFGNAITNIKADVSHIKSVIVKNLTIPLVPYYASVAAIEKPSSNVNCLINSDGYLEIFVFKGNAAKELGLKKGDIVEVLLNG